MTKVQERAEKRKQSKARIKKWLKPSSTLFIFQASVSASGMSRKLKLMTYKRDRLIDLTREAATLLEWPYTKDGFLRVGGCGMDMHLHTADCLTWELYGNRKPKGLKGNGGGCINWQSIY